MGLDFVVLQRENDDSDENWPGHELDARRADDPDPAVQAELRRVYDAEYSPAAVAASAAFRRWTPAPRPESVLGVLFYPVRLLIGWPVSLASDWRAKRRDEARVIPDFETWRTEQVNKDPPPVVLPFGPNCPPEGVPRYVAAVQWYGFRGQVVEPENNALARWWETKAEVDLMMMYYGEGFDDVPPEVDDAGRETIFPDTIAEAADMFRRMRDDCAATFPEIAAAAADPTQAETLFGPFPDRGLDEAVYADDFEAICGAARFFAFWQGRGYRIAPDF